MLKHCEPLLQVTAPLFQWGSGTVWIINVKVFNLIMIFKTHFKTVLPGYLIIIRQLTRDKYAHEAPFILHIFSCKKLLSCPQQLNTRPPLFQLLPVPTPVSAAPSPHPLFQLIPVPTPVSAAPSPVSATIRPLNAAPSLRPTPYFSCCKSSSHSLFQLLQDPFPLFVSAAASPLPTLFLSCYQLSVSAAPSPRADSLPDNTPVSRGVRPLRGGRCDEGPHDTGPLFSPWHQGCPLLSDGRVRAWAHPWLVQILQETLHKERYCHSFFSSAIIQQKK